MTLGDYGFVKTGVRRSNGRKETIKVIVKRKHDPAVLQAKLESIKAVLTITNNIEPHSPFKLLAQLHGLVETEKKLYVSSELIVGIELQKRIIMKAPLSESQTKKLVKDLANLLTAYQDKDLLYSDLRPEKVIITEDSAEELKVKIVDNGNSLCSKGCIPFDTFRLFYPKVA